MGSRSIAGWPSATRSEHALTDERNAPQRAKTRMQRERVRRQRACSLRARSAARSRASNAWIACTQADTMYKILILCNYTDTHVLCNHTIYTIHFYCECRKRALRCALARMRAIYLLSPMDGYYPFSCKRIMQCPAMHCNAHCTRARAIFSPMAARIDAPTG